MKISKHLHSCLLVEENGTTVLLDPGVFTYQENALDISKLSALDYILITHEHADHMHVPFLKDLLAKFPKAQIISNPSIEKILRAENITVHTDLSVLPKDTGIQFEELLPRRAHVPMPPAFQLADAVEWICGHGVVKTG